MKTMFKSMVAAGVLFGTAQAAAQVQYEHVRNATAKINYGGSTFLVDPYLADKGAYEGFAGTVNSDKRNPLIDMKQPAQELIKGVDAVIVTHTHADHWDKAAQELLPKDLPVFVQNAGDAQILRGQGFKDVRVMGKETAFNKVRLTRIKGGQHGTDQMYESSLLAERLGDAMGFVMQSEGEKTLYAAGDTVWNQAVDNAIGSYRPDIIVLNTGYARLQNMDGGIIMGTEDVAHMAKVAPNAAIIAVHMDAVNHTTVSSDDMRRYVKTKGLEKRVAIPKEGETLKF